MQRYDFFFRQKVTEGELDAAFDAVETLEFNSHLDQGIVGIQDGAVVTQNAGTPNLTVDISGPASIRDQLGQRIGWTAAQDLDCSVDENSNSTAVVTPGNEKYLSIFAKFVRTLSDPRLDGTGATVFYNRAESFELNVAQGAEAPISTAVRPSTRSDEILLADVRLINGQTQILNADISTTRRESALVTTLLSGAIRNGQIEAHLQAVVSQLETDLTGAGNLADQTAPDDGATLIGVDAIADAPDSTSQGTLKAVLTELLALINTRARLASAESISGAWTHTNDLAVTSADVNLTDAPIVMGSSSPTVARLQHLATPTTGSGTLLAEFGTDGGGIHTRLYAGDFGFTGGNALLYVAYNCRWTGTQWAYDDNTQDASLMAIGAEIYHSYFYTQFGSTPWNTSAFEAKYTALTNRGANSNFSLRIAYAGVSFYQSDASSRTISCGGTWGAYVSTFVAPSSTGVTVIAEAGTTGADSVINPTTYGATASKATTAAAGQKTYIVEIDGTP